MNSSTPSEAATPEHELDGLIDRLAATPRLLVASDYDGTLAPIVRDPAAARPVREAVVALRALAELPHTAVAVISGRALADLSGLAGLPAAVHLIGSHGSEYDVGFVDSLSAAQRDRLRGIVEQLNGFAAGAPGCEVEVKPASAAFHYRRAEPAVAGHVVREIEQGLARESGVHVKRGKMVIELAVVETSKAHALQTLRHRLGVNATVFIGDDLTDEDAFAALRPPDTGVKVGPGATVARIRVDDPNAVTRLLAKLAERRAEWLAGLGAIPIQNHALLSDRRTVALVTPSARVSWFCAPRLDSPALFAELLGGPSAGYFSAGPADGSPARAQRYDGDSLVLVTEFDGFTVTDFLDCSGGQPRQRAGRTDLTRLVRGTGRVRAEFAPRLDFGRTPTRLRQADGGLLVLDSNEPMVLRADGIQWDLRRDGIHETGVAEFELHGQPVSISLRCGAGTLRASTIEAPSRAERTREYWSDWASSLNLPTVATGLVKRSALTLRALSYGPTGAIAAAATTSLPEEIGGVRNWDYRYCWPRDAAVAAIALVKLGSITEAMHLLDWILAVVDRTASPERLSPIYTVTGEELGAEGEIGELAGYAGSRPVRVGNAASRQVQLDVFGPISELVWELAQRDAPLAPAHWRIVEAMVNAVRNRWNEPDHGIWEIRGTPRQHVHSRVMCWLAVERGIRTAQLLHDQTPDDWARLRDEIAEDVLTNGWSESAGAYSGWYGADDLDAAALWIGLSGLVSPRERRFGATVDAVERSLANTSGVYRYVAPDGLPGREGVFNLCTCWLILSLVAVGRIDEARARFEAFTALAGPTGLISEEHDHETNRALGNVPQAYSHAGLIECAIALADASHR